MQYSSFPATASAESRAFLSSLDVGSIIAESRPQRIAIDMNAALMKARFGSPKDTFHRPQVVFAPVFSLTSFIVSSAVSAFVSPVARVSQMAST